MQPDDLFSLTLVDGLAAERDGKTIKYRQLRLRETCVADERKAQRMAERVVPVAGVPRLLVSDNDFRYAMTMLHIEYFECDGQRIDQTVLDLDLMGKLSSHDLGLIEQRVFLVELAAEVRYGNMSQADFDLIVQGTKPLPADAPQRVGQAAGVGQAPADPQSGPALLASFTGADAHGTPAGDAR